MREVLLMDKGWRFHEGDVQDCVEHGYMYTYMHTKTERGHGPASMDYDDRKWEEVSIPHDYAVLNRPTPEANPVHGSLIRRQAWYRRNFKLEVSDREKRVRIWFEGICSRSHIWVNGCYMGFSDSAYTEIDLDITDIARYGDDLNTVAVYVDNTEYEGWWYEGAGIYRHVWLVKTDKISMERDGVWIHPEKISEAEWKTPVETTLSSIEDKDKELYLCQEIQDRTGSCIAKTGDKFLLKARKKMTVEQVVNITDPKLWSVETPELYTLVTTIYACDGEQKVTDTVKTTFGFRTICFDAEKGFLLNGVPTKIKGMCIHEDHGGFGVAVPDRIKEYRVQCLKKMGCNGYRFSHNPHSRATLDACDRLGMLVMDENRWFESSENGLRRLTSMVRRDRNHPCVVLWSVGNEESLQAGERGKKIMSSMKAAIREYDRERPVLMAMHTGLLEEGAADVSDVIGMNYNITLVPKVHERYPDKAIIFSEANSCNDEDVLGDREGGIQTWKIVHETPYVCGLFAWTGMDYRGEHDYPGLFALCGAMDQNGYPKESYSLYQSWWKDEAIAAIEMNRNPNLPVNQVRLIGNGDFLELYRNGQKIYETSADYYYPAECMITDRSGVFKLKNYKAGELTAEESCVLEGVPSSAELKLENRDVKFGCSDIAIFTLRVLDADGYLLSNVENEYQITSISGGRFLMNGNGDVQDASDRCERRGKTYRGLAQILIEPLEEKVILEVKVEGLNNAIQKEIKCLCGRSQATVKTVKRRYITDWEMAEWISEKTEITEQEFLSLKGYRPVEVGHGTQMHDLYKDSGFLNYHAKAEIPRVESENEKLYLQFELLEGKSDVLIILRDKNGTAVSSITERKGYEEPGELSVMVDAAVDIYSADIYVCLEVFMPFCGITKPVRWYFK